MYIILGARAANFLFLEDFISSIFFTREMNNKLVFVLPHSSPLNARWFNKNPSFLDEKVFEVRDVIHAVLQNS